MYKRCGTIYPYLAILATGWWWMTVDVTAALSNALRDWQEDNSKEQAEAQLAIALTRVVERKVKPSLQKKLKPEDVDDVCSEVILGFWKFRQSVRPDETGKLVNTLVQRKLNDQLRGYYKDAEHVDRELSEDERELTALLPAKDADPGGQETQAVWELLYEKELSAQDHLVAYTVYLGIDKQVIAKMFNMSGSAVTRSLKRCRKALTNPAVSEEKTNGHA